jgi:carboxyl-terminal processing protease
MGGKPPELTPRDTRVKIEEILRAHATHHALNQELMKRSFQNFFEILDPIKTYLIEDEIIMWTSPSDQLLGKALENFKNEKFTEFEQMYEVMLKAIARRNKIENDLQSQLLPKGEVLELKDLKWASSERDLAHRISIIKSLQAETAAKLDANDKNVFVQRIERRRTNKELELISDSTSNRKKLILSYVLKAVSSSLDSQTAYFTPTEASQFMTQMQQRLFGIGAQLRDDLNGLTIMRILEGSPASQEKSLKVGDRIIAVNKEPIIGMDTSEAVELIRGPEGTPVTLTLLRKKHDTNEDYEKFDVKLTRGEVVFKEARLDKIAVPFGYGTIGVLRLFSFYQDPNNSSAGDLLEAINALKKEHDLKGIILDLRTNAGGLLPQAVSVAGLFMSKGVVVSIKDNKGAVQKLRNTESSVAWDGPLIILTSKASASASEIVAQTLQEYGRALVVGDLYTYGKGTFQTFTLETSHHGKINPKGEYKVTRGRYYTVSGKSPQLVGVSADILVPGIYSKAEFGENYVKFPLETDQIEPSFNDDLLDIPEIHRAQVARIYKFNLQPVLTTYQPFLPRLKQNSAGRIQSSKNYQNFITEIGKKDFYADSMEEFGQADLQLNEAIRLMKDLLCLTKA